MHSFAAEVGADFLKEFRKVGIYVMHPQSKTASGPTARAKPKLRTVPPSSSAKSHPLDEAPTQNEPIWEQDNPVKTRIDQLRARNAQLAEQLQRLPQMPTARGNQP